MAATDMQRLIVSLEAQTKKFENALNKANGVANSRAKAIENRFQKMNTKLSSIGSSAARGLIGPLAGVGAALSTREIIAYADAWTVAENKIAAAGQVAGREGRSLTDLNKIANETRSDITATTDLYAKLLRATKDVAQSEQEVATATEVVNKAFKAGGAATSEQIAGVLQLSQALGSGFLQGDELRSLRENAPLIAQAIADEFKTTIGGLKKLGSEGELTSARVFKAILAAQKPIEAAFATTNATIADSFTRLRNSVIEYVGLADDANGASAKLQSALNALAGNVDVVADAVLVLSGIMLARFAGKAIGGATAAVYGLVAAQVAERAASVAQAQATLQTAQTTQLAAAANLKLAQSAYAAATASTAVGAGARKAATAVTVAQNRMAAANAALATSTVATNAAIARTGIVATTAAGGLRALSGAMTLLGGPVGVALLASYAIYELSTSQSKGTEASKTYAAALQEVIDKAKEIPAAVGEAAAAIDEKTRNALTGGVEEGVSAIEDAKAAVLELFTEIIDNAPRRLVSEDQLASLGDLKDGLEDGTKSSKDVENALFALANSDPKFQALADQLAPLLTALGQAIAATDLLQAKLGSVGGMSAASVASYKQYGSSRAEGDKMVEIGKQYASELERQNSLSKEQLAIEKEMKQIRDDLKDKGGFLDDNSIRGLAAANVAAVSDRRSAGRKPKESEYAREVEQIRERTIALQAETETQRGLNPLVDDYGYAVEKVRAEQDLLAAAQKAGLQVTPELRDSISQLAEGYAQASVEAKKLAENQDAVREAAEDFKQTGKDVMSGFISDLRSGKSASEALANALNKVADKLIDVALNSAFGIGKTGGGGGGFLGGILGGIGKLLGFAQGGYTGSGGKNEPAGIVHKGEYVMDAATTKRIGVRNLRRLQGYSSGGPVGSAPALPTMTPRQPAQGGSIAVSVTTEVQNGNLVPLVTAVAGQVAGRQIKQVNRNFQGRLQAVNSRGT